MPILKQKLSVLRKTKCSHKNNKKELRNSVCYIATIFQLVSELEKTRPVLKRIFFLGKI